LPVSHEINFIRIDKYLYYIDLIDVELNFNCYESRKNSAGGSLANGKSILWTNV
jgi:hypothetical protein